MFAARSSPQNCIDRVAGAKEAKAIARVALVGNSVPRRCGLATFTSDCHCALTARFPGLAVDVYAMTDRIGGYAYPPEVRRSVRQDRLSDYRDAGTAIRRSGADVIWLQHEFGIFGGAAGENILALLDEAAVPVVVTFHTVLSEPSDEQRAVMDGLIRRAASLIVMADHGRGLLENIYGADPLIIDVVPHGIPDRPFEPDESVRMREGLSGHDVVMTFGLLSPNKGIEQMIEALPAIVRRFPRLLYMVIGATHPHLVAAEGEAYRDKLKEHAARLGVADHLRWVDEFLGVDELVDLLSVADIYVTPYLNPAQITSGTLAYAVGLGKPVVSTPYVHAREILADDHGRLVPFRDPTALADQVIDLLSHPDACLTLRRRAYALGRTMIWSQLADAMMDIFVGVVCGKVGFAAKRANVDLSALSRRQATSRTERHAIDPFPLRDDEQRSTFARREAFAGETKAMSLDEKAL
jgi:glycosyltransferase involved in cell wall biosynthesis